MDNPIKPTEKTAPTPVDLVALSAYFARDLRVAAATVFGSATDGCVRPGSDIDIAVLFREPLAPEHFLRFYAELCDQIPNVEKVDLITLNQADPILAFEAIRGRFLCKNDPDQTAAFFSLVCREYEDVMGNLEHQRHLAA
jgi:predicted nucleotidyltransferase